MRREITQWYSERLLSDMPIVTYGHYGTPILMLPTAAADFLEYERFYLIEVIRPWIDAGKIKLYAVNSVNNRSLLNRHAPAQVKVDLLTRYDAYLVEEVLPFIRTDCQSPDLCPYIAGISLGAYLTANTFFRHPHQFGGAMLFSGTYDIRSFLGGFYSDEVYFNNPVDFMANLHDDYHLPLLRGGSRPIILFTGQGAHEDPERTRYFASLLEGKGIPHWLDVWGMDVNHDWPWWRKAMPFYLEKLFGHP